ncbi:hypothetical protein [Streptomyces sp. ok210]|nr:hypothetical protein [Streptomyces sp. ok210]
MRSFCACGVAARLVRRSGQLAATLADLDDTTLTRGRDPFG